MKIQAGLVGVAPKDVLIQLHHKLTVAEVFAIALIEFGAIDEAGRQVGNIHIAAGQPSGPPGQAFRIRRPAQSGLIHAVCDACLPLKIGDGNDCFRREPGAAGML